MTVRFHLILPSQKYFIIESYCFYKHYETLLALFIIIIIFRTIAHSHTREIMRALGHSLGPFLTKRPDLVVFD